MNIYYKKTKILKIEIPMQVHFINYYWLLHNIREQNLLIEQKKKKKINKNYKKWFY